MRGFFHVQNVDTHGGSIRVFIQKKSGYFIFTGGVGKDSGDLTVSEAEYLGGLAVKDFGVNQDKVYLETRATNGAENCSFSLETILGRNLPHSRIALLTHPTSLRRLAAVMYVKSLDNLYSGNFKNTIFERIGSGYSFNPLDSINQKEAMRELLRLANWPNVPIEKKGPWSAVQSDLPSDLVDYARRFS